MSKKITLLPGGWRKKVYLVETKNKRFVQCFWPKKSLTKAKILKALNLEKELTLKKVINARLPLNSIRQPADYILNSSGDYWSARLTYIPGIVKWQWNEKDSFKIGQLSAKLHKASVCHFDLKPGNIIWNKKSEIAGVIDFEEAHQFRRNKKLISRDLANTLSWILISGGDEKEFFNGYYHQVKQFQQFNNLTIFSAKINYYLTEFLKQRMKEGNKEAFIQLAKKRFENSQRKIKSKLLTVKDLLSFRKKNRNKKIVFTIGAFELLHLGHIDYLKKAKAKGDILVVGIASDSSRKRLKGSSFPLVGEKTRAETLCFFNFVDATVIIPEDDVLETLKELQPDVFLTVKKDWEEGVRKKEEEAMVKKYGGKIIKAFYSEPIISSSQLVEEVAMLKIKQVLLGKFKRQPILKTPRKKLNKKNIRFSELEKLGKILREQGKKSIFTSLSADLFHLGHARFIQKAKSCADILVTGVPSNESVAALKGKGRPIVDETTRAGLLAELEDVDNVVIFDERTILGCLQKLKPDFFFTVKEDWNTGLVNSPEAKLIQSYGGKIIRSERQAPFISASKMIDKAAGDLIQKRLNKVLETAQKTPVLNADLNPFSPEAQLTAREKGFYQQIWKYAAEKKCVFCDLKEKYIIAEKNNVVLTVALYPYTDGHLLIIPKRHIESINELNKKEWQTILNLAKFGKKLLQEKMELKNIWLLVREGNGVETGKTVLHLHFHLLPYNPEIFKMSGAKLTIAPIDLATKLKKKRQ